MNPVLAGIGLLAAAFKLGATRDWGIKPLSSSPDDLELGEQFFNRVSKADSITDDQERLMYGVDRMLSEPKHMVEGYTDDEEDEVFRSEGGCSSSHRRTAKVIDDHIAEIRKVSRHPDFNPYTAGAAWRKDCIDESGHKKTCEQHWREVDAWWDRILESQLRYRELERRNCPALISGLSRRRLGA